MKFFCPYCGALKDRSLSAGTEEDEGDGPLGFMACNVCLRMMVWTPGPNPVPRTPTHEEMRRLNKSALAQASFEHARKRMLERVMNPIHSGHGPK